MILEPLDLCREVCERRSIVAELFERDQLVVDLEAYLVAAVQERLYGVGWSEVW